MRILLVGLLCVQSLLLMGQGRWVKGKVMDSQTKEALPYVNISYCDKVSVTDLDGGFAILLPPNSNCAVRFEFVGYEPVLFRDFHPVDGWMDIEMTPSDVLLKTAVVTGSKYEVPLEKSTVSLDVVSPAFITSQSVTSLDDVLDKMPSVQIVDGQANIRGGSGWAYGAGSRVLLLLDDLPIMQPDAGFPHWNDLPIENIGQVEILKGAASALYGSAAMNGIINVRTQYAKSAPELEAGGLFRAYLSPPDTINKWWGDTLVNEHSAYMSYRRKIGKLDLVLGGYYRSNDSYLQKTYSKYGRANIRLRYRPSDRLNYGLYINANSTDGQSYFYWDKAYSYAPSTLIGLASNKSIRANIDPFINYYDHYGNKHRLMGRYLSISNTSSDNRSTLSNLSYLEYQWHRGWKALGLHMTAGLVANQNDVQAELYNDTTYVSHNAAVYLQADKVFGERWTVSAGLRYEYNDVIYPAALVQDTLHDGIIAERRPVWRFGSNYKLARATHLRASWGQGYRFPTIAEQFIKTEAGIFRIIPNPYLTSETGWTTELGLKQGYRVGGIEGFADVSLFWSEYQDMMEFSALVQDFQLYFQSQNVGNTVIRGVDANVMGRWNSGAYQLNYLAGYTYVDPRFQEYDSTGFGKPIVDPGLTQGQRNAANSSYKGNVLKYRNKHSFKTDVELQWRGLFIGVNVSALSEVLAIDRVFELIIPGMEDFRKEHKGYTLTNVRLGGHYKQFRLTCSLDNAFNTIYVQRPGILKAPRSFVVKLDMKW